MSDRTWVGEGTKEYADYNSCDFSNLTELAKAMAWKTPAKLIGDNPETLMELLEILDLNHSMSPSEFWWIKLNYKESKLIHPEWDEVESYLELKRKLNEN